MINYIGKRIEKTNATLSKSNKTPLSVIKERGFPKSGEKRADFIAESLTGDNHLLITSYLAAEGIKRIFIREDVVETDIMSALLVSKKQLKGEKIRNIFENVSVGDAILFYNPNSFDKLTREDQLVGIEHEAWHLYLDRAFPKHANGMRSLINWAELVESFSNSPMLEFIFQLEHLYLRVVAMEAGRYDFAAKDAKWTFNHFVNKYDHSGIRCREEDYLAVLHAGAGIGYTAPFWLNMNRNETAKNTYHELAVVMKNWRSMLLDRFGLSDLKNTSRGIMEICTGIKFDHDAPGYLRTDDISRPIMDYWGGILNLPD